MINLENMNQEQLLELRDEITKRLPDITTLDLSSELVGTYLKLKELLEDSLEELGDVSPNKLATLVNSINSSLRQLTEFQKELYNVNRQRAFEQAIYRTFENADKSLKEIFLKLLEEELETI